MSVLPTLTAITSPDRVTPGTERKANPPPTQDHSRSQSLLQGLPGLPRLPQPKVTNQRPRVLLTTLTGVATKFALPALRGLATVEAMSPTGRLCAEVATVAVQALTGEAKDLSPDLLKKLLGALVQYLKGTV